ncbi:unnamed protein product [Linum trigynum]|uniref:Uncharacterized protein n=2 Tax=Linum trigynum TaxID=586398 RepID=A0AAV2E1F9_9ROSI
MEEEVVVMEEEVSQGTVRDNNMFSRVYSRKGCKKTVLPVVQELEVPAVTSTVVDTVVQQMDSPAIVSTFDQVVESKSIVQAMVIHYTDPDTTFADVMQIGFQATAAPEESIGTSPTTIPVESTAVAQESITTSPTMVVDPSTEVLTQGEAGPSEEELIAATYERMEDSDDDIIIFKRIRTEEEAEYLYSITPEAWKATLKTPEFDRSRHHPFGKSVYVLPKTLSTKLDDTALQVVEFIFSTTAKDE